MTAPAVVDASVVRKWLVSENEQGVEEALQLLSAHIAAEVSLVAPTSLPVEIANSLRHSNLDEADSLALLTALDEVHLGLHGTTGERIRRATELAYRHKLSVYDALFLQLAEELLCPLVTADRRAFENLDVAVEIHLI